MDIDAQVDRLVDASQAWLPVIMAYSGRVLLALVVLAIGWWLINRLTHNLSALIGKRLADPALQGFIGTLANIILKVLLVISAASMIGVETTSFIAAIGAAGLAIGLALQGSLANFAGGVLILLFRPFRIGDVIEAQGVTGTVDNIQIFHTVLRTGDNKTVIMPNGSLSNGIITNYNRQATRQVVFDIGIDYDADLQAAKQVLLDMAEDERVLKDPAPAVVVAALGDSSIKMSLRVWVNTGDYWSLTFKFNEEIRDRLQKANIAIPFPQRVIRMIQDPA